MSGGGRRKRSAAVRPVLALIALAEAEGRPIGLEGLQRDLAHPAWGRLRAWLLVRRLERKGLVRRGPAALEVTDVHLRAWRPLSLTAAGRATLAFGRARRPTDRGLRLSER